jgi:hypothetical protein
MGVDADDGVDDASMTASMTASAMSAGMGTRPGSPLQNRVETAPGWADHQTTSL